MNDFELDKTLCAAVSSVACLVFDSLPDTSVPIDPDFPLSYVIVNLLTLDFLVCDSSELSWTPELSAAMLFDSFDSANDFIQKHAISDSAVFHFSN